MKISLIFHSVPHEVDKKENDIIIFCKQFCLNLFIR